MNIQEHIEEWRNNYKKYIEFQCAVLIHAHEFGGMKFSKYQLPPFDEFEKYIGDIRYDYTAIFNSEEYNLSGRQVTFHNTTNCQFRPDLHWCKVSYSYFKGIKWNFKFQFRIDTPDLSQVDRKIFISKFTAQSDF